MGEKNGGAAVVGTGAEDFEDIVEEAAVGRSGCRGIAAGEARIADLLASMGCHRRTMERILEFCLDRRPVAGVNAWVEQLQGQRAVYDAAALCRLLEEAGALVRERDAEVACEADACEGGRDAEAPHDAGAARGGEPAGAGPVPTEAVPVAGGGAHAYLSPRAFRTSYWKTTEAGRAYLEAESSKDAVAILIEEEPDLWPVYEELLRIISEGEGPAQPQILERLGTFGPYLDVADRISSSRLIDKACKVGLIVWDNGWRLTGQGEQALC